MTTAKRSPRITHLEWGKLEIDSQQRFKDAKLFPGGSRAWDWKETGTRHVPGIQTTDVTELLDNGATAIVLSKGMWERLQVCPETLQMLEQRNVEVHVLQTELAVNLYNKLAETEPVGGLFHSTC